MKKSTPRSAAALTREECSRSIVITGMALAILIVTATVAPQYRHILNCGASPSHAALCAAVGAR